MMEDGDRRYSCPYQSIFKSDLSSNDISPQADVSTALFVAYTSFQQHPAPGRRSSISSMAASQPLFDATIEPDEDPVRNTSSNQFPAGNIGSSGASRSQNQPVTLTPGPAPTGISSTSGNAEMGIVSGPSRRS